MEKKLILRGAFAGAIGGVVAFVFARIFAEPLIQRAIDYESGRDAAQAALDKAAGVSVPPEGPDIFSRTVQANVGIGVGMVAFGVAMGVLVAVAYTICWGRVGAVRPRALALLVAGGGLVGIYLVPFAKYPANPPAVGHEDTIRDRGVLYLTMVLVSVLCLIGAVWLGRRLAARIGAWNATLVAGLGFIAVIAVAILVLPAYGHLAVNVHEYGRHATETPRPLKNPAGEIVYPGFPADLLSGFRMYSVAAQLLLWAVIGLVFAPLAERVLERHGEARAEARPVHV